jgi:hypothetical protein
MPMVKMVPRGFTAAADAYLTPHIRRYCQQFTGGFDAGLKHVQARRPSSSAPPCWRCAVRKAAARQQHASSVAPRTRTVV